MPRRIGQDIVTGNLRWHRTQDRHVDVQGESFTRYQRWTLVIPEGRAGLSVWDRSRREWARDKPRWADVSVERFADIDGNPNWQVGWVFQPHGGRRLRGYENTRNLATVAEIVDRFQRKIIHEFTNRYEWRPSGHMGLNVVSILEGGWHPDRHPARLRSTITGGSWVHDVLWWEPTAPQRTETPPAPRYEVQRVEVGHLGSGWWQEQRVRV